MIIIMQRTKYKAKNTYRGAVLMAKRCDSVPFLSLCLGIPARQPSRGSGLSLSTVKKQILHFKIKSTYLLQIQRPHSHLWLHPRPIICRYSLHVQLYANGNEQLWAQSGFLPTSPSWIPAESTKGNCIRPHSQVWIRPIKKKNHTLQLTCPWFW